jgi:hypothetical protein
MSGPAYTGKLSLAERFRKLLHEGAPPADAVEQLAELYYAFHFRIVQPLPDDPTFRLGDDGELVVELDGRQLDPERILTREPGLLDPVPIPLDQYRWMCADPRQAERDALAELTIDALTVSPPPPPKPPPIPVAPNSGPPPPIPPSKRKRSKPRHRDWKPIRKHFVPHVAKHGKWLNPHLAATEVHAWAIDKGLTISFEALYKGIPNFFPEWIETDSKG